MSDLDHPSPAPSGDVAPLEPPGRLDDRTLHAGDVIEFGQTSSLVPINDCHRALFEETTQLVLDIRKHRGDAVPQIVLYDTEAGRYTSITKTYLYRMDWEILAREQR